MDDTYIFKNIKERPFKVQQNQQGRTTQNSGILHVVRICLIPQRTVTIIVPKFHAPQRNISQFKTAFT